MNVSMILDMEEGWEELGRKKRRMFLHFLCEDITSEDIREEKGAKITWLNAEWQNPNQTHQKPLWSKHLPFSPTP